MRKFKIKHHHNPYQDSRKRHHSSFGSRLVIGRAINNSNSQGLFKWLRYFSDPSGHMKSPKGLK